MHAFGFHACDVLIAIAPRKLRHQLVYNDRSLKVCSGDLEPLASAVTVHY